MTRNGSPGTAEALVRSCVANATGVHHETDSMGHIDVPAERYWGTRTQRSLVHFSIDDDRMPKRVYHAYSYVKKAAAR
jgi:fumarate hydratase class II